MTIDELNQQLEQLEVSASKAVEQAKQSDELQQVRVTYLGKKSELTQLLKGLKELSDEDKRSVGESANHLRANITQQIDEKQTQLATAELDARLQSERIDVTMPGRPQTVGHEHVLQQIINQIEDHFIGQGYQVFYGDEVETDEYNFERMNLPKDHPARDMQDTFYLTPDILLRTQTSPMQARVMEKHDFSKGPLKMISPGIVYRRDTDDPTHSHQFHQIEGLVIGEKITMGDLKGTLLSLVQMLLGEKHQIRLRPSYFPFTEPSVEVDVSWNEVTPDMSVDEIDWIEALGAGMVHPNVLEMSGVDSSKYGGFAFGLGPDRLAMLNYGVDDIRQFYLNDVRFLEQF